MQRNPTKAENKTYILNKFNTNAEFFVGMNEIEVYC